MSRMHLACVVAVVLLGLIAKPAAAEVSNRDAVEQSPAMRSLNREAVEQSAAMRSLNREAVEQSAAMRSLRHIKQGLGYRLASRVSVKRRENNGLKTGKCYRKTGSGQYIPYDCWTD